MRICCNNCGGNTNGCKWCQGTGLCCPTCLGVGWLKQVWNIEDIKLVRCTTCYLGGEFNSAYTMRAIVQYIESWFAGNVPDEVLTHQKDAEREAKEARAKQQAGGRLWKHG